jgi:hypothetical protein
MKAMMMVLATSVFAGLIGVVGAVLLAGPAQAIPGDQCPVGPSVNDPRCAPLLVPRRPTYDIPGSPRPGDAQQLPPGWKCMMPTPAGVVPCDGPIPGFS